MDTIKLLLAKLLHISNSKVFSDIQKGFAGGQLASYKLVTTDLLLQHCQLACYPFLRTS